MQFARVQTTNSSQLEIELPLAPLSITIYFYKLDKRSEHLCTWYNSGYSVVISMEGKGYIIQYLHKIQISYLRWTLMYIYKFVRYENYAPTICPITLYLDGICSITTKFSTPIGMVSLAQFYWCNCFHCVMLIMPCVIQFAIVHDICTVVRRGQTASEYWLMYMWYHTWTQSCGNGFSKFFDHGTTKCHAIKQTTLCIPKYKHKLCIVHQYSSHKIEMTNKNVPMCIYLSTSWPVVTRPS